MHVRSMQDNVSSYWIADEGGRGDPTFCPLWGAADAARTRPVRRPFEEGKFEASDVAEPMVIIDKCFPLGQG